MALQGALCAAVLTWAGSAAAQETLYGKQPPHGSAYIRLVNARLAPVTVNANFQPEARLGNTAADRVGAYAVVEQVADRTLIVTIKDEEQDGSLSFKAPPDGFVTVIIEPDAGKAGAGKINLVPVVDQADFNQTRSRVSFYNAVPGCSVASLSLEAGAAVFQGVAAGTVKSRTVNPVKAMVRASCGDHPGPSVMLDGLEVGASYSVWLIDPANVGGLFLTTDVLAPYKPR